MAGEVVGEAIYKTKVDQSGLDKGLADGEQKLERSGQSFSRFGSVAQGAFMGAGIAIANFGIGLAKAGLDAVFDTIGNSIELASTKAEAASKANVLFGESYGIVEEASRSAATTVGLSSGAYLVAAGNVGNLITNLGFAGDEAASMSVDVVKLAADVGSFNNAPTEEVVQAIGAAFRGETEPIRRFGVQISAAAVEQEYMALGLAKSKEEFNKLDFATQNNIKAQATYSLILKGTTAAQGDFERTSSGLANSQKIAAARMEEAWTSVGERLAPLAAELLPMLADAVVMVADGIGEIIDWVREWIDDNEPLIRQLQELWELVEENIGPALQLLGQIIGALGMVFGGLVGIVVDTIGALVDLGGVIVNIFAGKWEEAARHGELAMTRLQGVQINMQRVSMDAGRQMLDNHVAALDAIAERQEDHYEDMSDAGGDAWLRFTGQAAGGVQDVADAIEDGAPQVQTEAEQMAGTLPDALADANREAKIEAAKTPGQIASGLRSTRDDWRSALDLLKDDMRKSGDATAEIAELKAKLTGKALTKGLASTDPIVRAQAEETQRLIQDRLAALERIARNAGVDAGEAFGAGFVSTKREVIADLDNFTRTVENHIRLGSPAREGRWSVDGGPIEWMRRDAERMIDAFEEPWHRIGSLMGSALAPAPAANSTTVSGTVHHLIDISPDSATSLRSAGYDDGAVARALADMLSNAESAAGMRWSVGS